MTSQFSLSQAGTQSVLATHKVLRNTYLLLSLTLIFSGMTAALAMAMNAPPMGLFTFILYMGLFFATSALRNSPLGLVCVFALTGTMGYTLGPLLNMYINGFSNGSQIVGTALGGTGFIFLGLSGYVLVSQKDFSYLGGMIMSGFMVLLVAMVVSLFMPMPLMHLLISCGFLLLSSAAIMFETSQIINGGERNYIMATVSLYLSIYNIFVSLLHILSAFSGRD